MSDEKKALWMCPTAPGKTWKLLTQLVQEMGLAGTIKVTTPDVQKLEAQLAEARALLGECKTAFEVYAMTNETFPEYGDVARQSLAKLNEFLGDK